MKGLKSKHSFINSPNQFSNDLYFVSFYILALSTGFIFVNTALQLEGRWPRVRVSNFPFPSRHYHFLELMNIYFILFFFFFFAFFVCFYSVIIVKSENRNSQPRIESADLRLCHRSRLGLLSIIALTILRKRNFGRLVCDNACLPFIKKLQKFWLGFFGR